MKVVACTPTRNRRWTWAFSRACMEMQVRRPDLWVIVDNSTSPAEDWSVARDIPGILYERVAGPRTVGALRNRCIELALEQGADIVVFWMTMITILPLASPRVLQPSTPTRTSISQVHRRCISCSLGRTSS